MILIFNMVETTWLKQQRVKESEVIKGTKKVIHNIYFYNMQ